MSELVEIIKTRRSVRQYRADQVAPETLDQILSAGLYAPSARNTQNWQLTVVQGTEKLELLRAALATALQKPDYGRFFGAPTLVLVSTPRDYDFGAFDSSTVLQNLFLAAHALNVGSVWINQLTNQGDHPEVRKVLTQFKVPENHRTWGSAALGYPLEPVKKDRENKGIVVWA